MSRISLPGKMKYKKIILLILVLISAGVLIYEFTNNIKDKSNHTKVNNDETEYFSGTSQYENIDKSEEYSAEDEGIKEVSKGDEIVTEFPESYLGYNIRGIAKAYNGNFDGGMSDIDKSLSIKPDYGYGRFNKALTYELYGQFDNALEWYNKALEIEDYVWTYYGIASIYGRRGDVNNTVEYLKKAIEIDSAVKQEARTESDFDPVRNSKDFKELIG